jgi:hypothetical protein
MKITNAVVEFIDYDGVEYIRFGPNSWWQWYGNSLETVFYEEEKLEKEYQNAIRK